MGLSYALLNLDQIGLKIENFRHYESKLRFGKPRPGRDQAKVLAQFFQPVHMK